VNPFDSEASPVAPALSLLRRRCVLFRSVFVFVALVVLVGLAGCSKKPLSPPEVRRITREMVFAARNAAGSKVEVGMRPETLPLPGVPAANRNAPPTGVTDHIYITLPGGAVGQPDAAAISAIRAAIDRVAAQHKLTPQELRGAPGRVRFAYLFAGRITHSVELIAPVIARRVSSPRSGKPQGPCLAIIIDDLGYDTAAADTLLSMPYPLTMSVIPHLIHSADVAEEAHRRGYEVLLHLPMESNAGEKSEAIELRRGASVADAERLLAGMLDTVPHAVGVNNHQGSLATADAALMNALMPALRERDFFFIDSRTTAQTVAIQAAGCAGVPSASRNVFLDDTETLGYVKQQLALAVREAQKNGSAIAIGHPHAGTLQALREMLPQIEGHGVTLVFASELVR
jgi:polysaccharide deacetylase 2 family uncharacterized protein YibQ